MSTKFSGKPIAIAAVVASSVGSALAAGGAAHATSYGTPPSPVTITAGGAINVVGGAKVALPAGAHDVSWAGQGGRFAYIGADNGVYTADYDGTHAIRIGQGKEPSHTVWDVSSEVVYWTEGTGATAKVVGALANGYSADAPHPTFDLVATPPAGLGLSHADVAADDAGSIVVQTTDGTGLTGISVVSYGADGKQTVTQAVAPGDPKTGGSAPTISPDGKTVVFVRTDANNDTQLFATSLQGTAWSAPKQITWQTGNHSAPLFEADNKTVAFEYANRQTPAGGATDGTYQVVLADALAAASPAPALEKAISTLSGGLAVRTDNAGHVYRFAGSDRTDTAVQTSRQAWRTNGAPVADTRQQAKAVVLSRSDLFADALGGSSLAAKQNGPLLLTDTKALPQETLTELQRILPGGGKVFLLGGTAAIAPTVEGKLKALGYTVQRIAGTDRFETAVKIAKVAEPDATDVLVATGTNFPDALSAGAAAGAYSGMVVVLTDGTTMPKVTDEYLQAKAGGRQLRYLAAIGGAADVALKGARWSGFDSLVGADRYQTSYLVAHDIFGTFGHIGVATGRTWPDALSGGALMGDRHGPLLLVDPAAGLSANDDALIDANRGAANWAYVFGGLSALPLRVDQQLAADIQTATGAKTGPGHDAATAPHLATPHVAKG